MRAPNVQPAGPDAERVHCAAVNPSPDVHGSAAQTEPAPAGAPEAEPIAVDLELAAQAATHRASERMEGPSPAVRDHEVE